MFAPEQVLVLIYDDFRGDNDGTVRRVLRFLEVVDETEPIEAIEANPSVRMRSQALDEIVHACLVGRGPAARAARGRASRRSRPQRLRRDALRLTQQRRRARPPPPAADEQFMDELRRRFKGEVVALSEYLGRDLVALWGYDRID